jgi:hypothetical protein
MVLLATPGAGFKRQGRWLVAEDKDARDELRALLATGLYKRENAS